MSRLAVIDLCVPGTAKSGRVFLERDLLSQTSVQQLEEQLGRDFDDPEGGRRPRLNRRGQTARCLGVRLRPRSSMQTFGSLSKACKVSPHHGDTEFTVPLKDQFMKRILPGDDWLTRSCRHNRARLKCRADEQFGTKVVGSEARGNRVTFRRPQAPTARY